MNYLAKQIEKEEKGKAYKLSGDVSGISHVEMKCYQTYIRSWKDYIEWAEKLEYDLKSRYVLFPKNFKDVHDKTFLEYQKQQDKMETFLSKSKVLRHPSIKNNKIRWKEENRQKKEEP